MIWPQKSIILLPDLKGVGHLIFHPFWITLKVLIHESLGYYPNDSQIKTCKKHVNSLKTYGLKSELPNLWFTFKDKCLLIIHLFDMALKVNHTDAGPKRGRPSHILPVQIFFNNLEGNTSLKVNCKLSFMIHF